MLLGFETLNLKCCDLKLWKLTVVCYTPSPCLSTARRACKLLRIVVFNVERSKTMKDERACKVSVLMLQFDIDIKQTHYFASSLGRLPRPPSPRFSATRPHTRTLYIPLSLYIYIYIYVYTCTHIYIYICIHISLYVYVYIYIHMYMYMYVCMYVYIYIYMCIYIYIYQPHTTWNTIT